MDILLTEGYQKFGCEVNNQKLVEGHLATLNLFGLKLFIYISIYSNIQIYI